MNTRTVTFFLLVLSVCLCNAEVTRPSVFAARNRVDAIVNRLNPEIRQERFRETSRALIWSIFRNGGCKVSACFALEGSTFISEFSFDLQVYFASLMGAIMSTDTNASFSATVYGRTTEAVNERTSDAKEFVDSVLAARRTGDNEANFGSGLGYCGFQVRRAFGVKRLVFTVGSGRTTDGFDPEIIADAITGSSTNGEIIPILTQGSPQNFQQILDLKKKDILTVRNFQDLNDVLSELIPSICNM